VRCMTCGMVIANKDDVYLEECKKIAENKADVSKGLAGSAFERPGDDGKTEKGRILDRMGIKRNCCRIVLMTTVYMDSYYGSEN
jgi:DNA-directed RNA polymerase subunit N (RpoN/RPB10)